MSNLRPFRFGLALNNASSKEDWSAKARRVEESRSYGAEESFDPPGGGGRFEELVLTMLLFAVVPTQHRQQVAELLAGRFQTTSEQLLQTPHCLIGTTEQMCEDLLACCERYGISPITVFGDNLETFAPVVAQ